MNDDAASLATTVSFLSRNEDGNAYDDSLNYDAASLASTDSFLSQNRYDQSPGAFSDVSYESDDSKDFGRASPHLEGYSPPPRYSALSFYSDYSDTSGLLPIHVNQPLSLPNTPSASCSPSVFRTEYFNHLPTRPPTPPRRRREPSPTPLPSPQRQRREPSPLPAQLAPPPLTPPQLAPQQPFRLCPVLPFALEIPGMNASFETFEQFPAIGLVLNRERLSMLNWYMVLKRRGEHVQKLLDRALNL